MKRFVHSACLVAALIVCTITAMAQNTEYIKLRPQQTTISTSVFSKVVVIDSRLDSGYLGYVNRGSISHHSYLKLHQPLANELTDMIEGMMQNASKQEGTLLINVHNFAFSEYTYKLMQGGRLDFKASCYFTRDSLYKHLVNIDTSFAIEDVDVSDKMLLILPERLGAVFKQLADYQLIQFVSRGTLTLYDVQHMDLVEKKEIPVYNVEVPAVGIYTNYEDFKNNRPSREDVIVEKKKGFSRPFVYEKKENGKKGKEILHKYYYMVSDGERLFASNKYGLYRVTKHDNDFYFTGKAKDEADAGTIFLATALMGFVGGIAAANNDLAIFDFKVDYVTGKFIALKKVKD